MQTGNSRRYTSFCSMETGRGREKRKKFRDISYRGLIALSFIDETSSNDNYYVELEGQVRIDELLTNGVRTCSYCFDQQLFTPCTDSRIYIHSQSSWSIFDCLNWNYNFDSNIMFQFLRWRYLENDRIRFPDFSWKIVDLEWTRINVTLMEKNNIVRTIDILRFVFIINPLQIRQTQIACNSSIVSTLARRGRKKADAKVGRSDYLPEEILSAK